MKIQKKYLLFIACICLISFTYAYEPHEKEYKNENLNNGVYYTGKVIISPGKQKYHNIWEIKSNSVKYGQSIIIVKCVEKTKTYTDFRKISDDDYTQYVVNSNCEFFANGRFADKWVYIKLLDGAWRWISVDKISFVTGSINELPELKFQETYSDGFRDITFYGKYVHIFSADGFDSFANSNMISEVLPLKVNTEKHLSYISFNNKRYLVLSNRNLLYLINENNKKVWVGVAGFSTKRMEVFGYSMPNVFSASTELEENGTIYTAKNLDCLDGNAPWVESVKGDGIGEYIKIDYDQTEGLIISNGYVSYDKPYLYESNNRVKVFEVYNQDNMKIQEISLIDTPNPQVFKIYVKSKSLKLVIKEVYKGSKWDDTCVNFIQIIPKFCSLDGFDLQN